MKYIKLSVIFISLIFIGSSLYSQPRLIFHITGGYTIPLGIFTGTIEKTDTMPSEWPYLMKNGYNFGADGKIAIGKKRNIRITFGVNYTSLHNKGDLVILGDTSQISEFKPNINILTLSLGAEYAFTPKEKSSPFLGFEVTGNFFSGNFDFSPMLKGNYVTSLKPESRYGLTINGGIDISFSRYIGAVFGIKFNWTNLFNKGSDNTAVKITETGLGDEEHMVNGNTRAARNITYFQPYIGVSFLLGHPKKIKK